MSILREELGRAARWYRQGNPNDWDKTDCSHGWMCEILMERDLSEAETTIAEGLIMRAYELGLTE